MYYLWNDTHRQKLWIAAVLENAEGHKSLWSVGMGREDGQNFQEFTYLGIKNSWQSVWLPG